MPSQFFKRKAKAEKADKIAFLDEPSKEPIVETIIESAPVVEAAPIEVSTPQYTQTGYDIFTPDGGRTYLVAEIEYNPATGQANVKDTFNITRLVALSYGNQKVALQTLKKGKN